MRRPTTTTSDRRLHAVRNGYRSGLEETISAQLDAAGVEYEYEPKDGKVPYTAPATEHTYTPDFVLKDGKLIVETKGIFDADDRKKHLLIKAQHPDLDIRFVFSNPHQSLTKDTKASASEFKKWLVRTQGKSTGFTTAQRVALKEAFLAEVRPRGLTYATWCDKHGFLWAARTVPAEWLS